MKILLITDLYPIKKDDSLPFIVRDFALGLKEMGNEITLIRPNFLLNSFIRRRKFIKQEEFFENGIKIYNRNFLTPFLFEKKSFLEKLKALYHVLDVQSSMRPDTPICAILNRNSHISSQYDCR